jgi:GT2 family glycosyltransferase
MTDSETVPDNRVAVVIVNWNGWRECIECLDSLFAQDHRNFHVFLVDNESHDGSVEQIAAWCGEPKADANWRRHVGVKRMTDQAAGVLPHRIVANPTVAATIPPGCRLTMVHSGGNLGFAGGCNVGIVTAGRCNFDYFWFLNADAVVDARALVELLARANRHANIGMVGSTVRYYDSPDVIQAMGGASLDRSNGSSRHIGEGVNMAHLPVDGSLVEQEMAYIMGASMLVSSAYIEQIGLMEEDYFLYFEDADWALRGHGKFLLGFAPRSHVFHKWGANSHKTMALFSSRFYYRNRLRFVARFLPGRLAAAKRAMVEQLLRHVARGRWQQARLVLATLWAAGEITAGIKPRVHEPA